MTAVQPDFSGSTMITDNAKAHIGKVSLGLDEGPFDPSETYTVVPGSRVEKAPKLINNGTKDEFVFMRIKIPKKSVTLLYEADDGTHDKGTPKEDLSGNQQIFRLIADTPSAPAPDNVVSASAVSGKDIEFSYHSDTAGADTVDGWILLDTDYSDNDYDIYSFGYNKLMKPEDQTSTLFDKVQLKSFIDAEAVGAVDIGVLCYGIQADNLKPDGVTLDLESGHFTSAELQAIYTIVKNKANID